jgi:hypothetical protein
VQETERGTALPNPAPIKPISSNIIRPLVDANDDLPTTLEIGAETNVSPLIELPFPDVNSLNENKGSTEIEHCNEGEMRAK